MEHKDDGNPTLAEQAMNIYEEKGEDEMLSFVQLRLDPRPAGHEYSRKALLVMEDHSALMVTGDRYFFLWTPSGEQSKHPMAASRTRTSSKRIPHNGNSRPVNVAGAVTRDTIMHEALKLVETDARLSLGHDASGSWVANDPPIGEDTVEAAAPSLVAQINTEAQGGIESDLLYQAMDDHARDMAYNALKNTSADERQALEAVMLETVRETQA